MTGLVKLFGCVPVSRELLDACFPRRLTPAEQERARQSRVAVEAEQARQLAVHARIVEHDTGLRHQVALLHAPVREGSGYVCEGCDAAGWEAEVPEWPCRTWRLLDDTTETAQEDSR